MNLDNPKTLDEDTYRPAAPNPSISTSVPPRDKLTLGMIESSPRKERGVIKDLTVHLSDTFLKNHSDTYCEYIALQTIELRDKFLTDHPLFSAESIIANAINQSANVHLDNLASTICTSHSAVFLNKIQTFAADQEVSFDLIGTTKIREKLDQVT